MGSLGRRFWQVMLARWPQPRRAAIPGPETYALVVPVPGDLPVFTHLALVTCALQNGSDRLETIVVPDRPCAQISALLAAARPGWTGPLREVRIRRPARAVVRRLGNAGRNHGCQIVAAVAATSASHVILHDADLFLVDRDAHHRQFRTTVEQGLDALGVSPAWDPWFLDHGRQLAATWEMVARIGWLRRFPPWRLLGHEAEVDGERHVFDTTFYAQWQTDPMRIGVDDRTGGFTHFGYLISHYRAYLQARDTFHDTEFVLLVIRILSDLFLPGTASTAVPDLVTLQRGLTDGGGRVSYLRAQPADYQRMRGLLQDLLNGAWVDETQRMAADQALAPFDARMA